MTDFLFFIHIHVFFFFIRLYFYRWCQLRLSVIRRDCILVTGWRCSRLLTRRGSSNGGKDKIVLRVLPIYLRATDDEGQQNDAKRLCEGLSELSCDSIDPLYLYFLASKDKRSYGRYD